MVGIPRLSVVNVVGSAIARETKMGVYLNAGRETAVASTKAFTTQVRPSARHSVGSVFSVKSFLLFSVGVFVSLYLLVLHFIDSLVGFSPTKALRK